MDEARPGTVQDEWESADVARETIGFKYLVESFGVPSACWRATQTSPVDAEAADPEKSDAVVRGGGGALVWRFAVFVSCCIETSLGRDGNDEGDELEEEEEEEEKNKPRKRGRGEEKIGVSESTARPKTFRWLFLGMIMAAQWLVLGGTGKRAARRRNEREVRDGRGG
ncbi:hypothetical protein IF1G_00449 [Cordyceps javanica]|uniref:Uncharacterized protein n=1 Tax=Cordyceps javanica TaxID=43265 RepID=A0A545VFL4_9HYPO|nr:hypothetical protein IF1G_00449 [Cordyceps javanica]